MIEGILWLLLFSLITFFPLIMFVTYFLRVAKQAPWMPQHEKWIILIGSLLGSLIWLNSWINIRQILDDWGGIERLFVAGVVCGGFLLLGCALSYIAHHWKKASAKALSVLIIVTVPLILPHIFNMKKDTENLPLSPLEIVSNPNWPCDVVLNYERTLRKMSDNQDRFNRENGMSTKSYESNPAMVKWKSFQNQPNYIRCANQK